MADLLPHQDPGHPYNGPAHQTGEPCIEGCGRPAGTAWSPLWCQPCNAERMDDISASLESMSSILTGRSQEARDGSR